MKIFVIGCSIVHRDEYKMLMKQKSLKLKDCWARVSVHIPTTLTYLPQVSILCTHLAVHLCGDYQVQWLFDIWHNWLLKYEENKHQCSSCPFQIADQDSVYCEDNHNDLCGTIADPPRMHDASVANHSARDTQIIRKKWRWWVKSLSLFSSSSMLTCSYPGGGIDMGIRCTCSSSLALPFFFRFLLKLNQVPSWPDLRESLDPLFGVGFNTSSISYSGGAPCGTSQRLACAPHDGIIGQHQPLCRRHQKRRSRTREAVGTGYGIPPGDGGRGKTPGLIRTYILQPINNNKTRSVFKLSK